MYFYQNALHLTTMHCTSNDTKTRRLCNTFSLLWKRNRNFCFLILHPTWLSRKFLSSSMSKVCDFYDLKPKGKLHYITEFSRFLNFPFLSRDFKRWSNQDILRKGTQVIKSTSFYSRYPIIRSFFFSSL